jgi:cysteine desulfurase
MGVLSEGNIRVSLPPGTARADVERFLDVLPPVVAEVRAHLGAPEPSPVAPEAAGEPAGLVVDSLGKRCPIPVIELAKVIGRVPVGGTVTVLSDDEAAALDIPAWCAMRSQDYLGPHPAPQGTAYLVRRRT